MVNDRTTVLMVALVLFDSVQKQMSLTKMSVVRLSEENIRAAQTFSLFQGNWKSKEH